METHPYPKRRRFPSWRRRAAATFYAPVVAGRLRRSPRGHVLEWRNFNSLLPFFSSIAHRFRWVQRHRVHAAAGAPVASYGASVRLPCVEVLFTTVFQFLACEQLFFSLTRPAQRGSLLG